MKIELTSKTLSPEQLKIVEDELNEFFELKRELVAAIGRLQQDAAFCLVTGLPAPKV